MRHFAFLAQGPNDGGERLCGLVGGLAIARATRGAMGDRSIPVPVKKVANHSRVRHPTDDRAAVFGSGTTLRTRSRTARPPADPGWPGPSFPSGQTGPLRRDSCAPGWHFAVALPREQSENPGRSGTMAEWAGSID